MKKDIAGKQEIRLLVDAFYDSPGHVRFLGECFISDWQLYWKSYGYAYSVTSSIPAYQRPFYAMEEIIPGDDRRAFRRTQRRTSPAESFVNSDRDGNKSFRHLSHWINHLI
jgi:hypothetical protein